MGTVVWKATVPLGALSSECVFKAPAFAEILTVAKQYDSDDALSIWFRCSERGEFVERRLLVVGTGHPAPPKHQARYVSTVIFMEGALVLHFFDEGTS